MTIEQALKNIDAAIASIQGNLQMHMALQESMKIIKQQLSLEDALKAKAQKPDEK